MLLQTSIILESEKRLNFSAVTNSASVVVLTTQASRCLKQNCIQKHKHPET